LGKAGVEITISRRGLHEHRGALVRTSGMNTTPNGQTIAPSEPTPPPGRFRTIRNLGILVFFVAGIAAALTFIAAQRPVWQIFAGVSAIGAMMVVVARTAPVSNAPTSSIPFSTSCLAADSYGHGLTHGLI
jgi:hypothetical protein